MKNMTGAIYVAGALDYETRKRVSTYDNFIKKEKRRKKTLTATKRRDEIKRVNERRKKRNEYFLYVQWLITF